MLNQWIGVGRWTEDISLRYTDSGKAVANADLATSDGFGDKETTTYHKVVMWEKLAENVANYSGKGRLVVVTGRYTNRTYEKDGQKRKVSEVVASSVRFLDKGTDTNERSAPKAASGMGSEPPFVEDDVPF